MATQSTALEPGAAAFYGVVGIEHLLRRAIAEGREWWYGDNAYLDAVRGKYFRFARNAMQWPYAPPDYARLRAIGVTVRPWRRSGRNVVVVEQSEHFLKLCGREYWLGNALRAIKAQSDRPVKVRRWSRDKAKAVRGLAADLKDAWCLVTHMSAAATEAVLAGVPVFVSGPCAAVPMASGDLANIETPKYPDGREEWAARLAAAQWTMDELRSGLAWRTLNT